MATMGNQGMESAMNAAKEKVAACSGPGEFRDLFVRSVQEKDNAAIAVMLMVLDKFLQSSPMTDEEEAEGRRLKKTADMLKAIKAPKVVVDQKVEDGLMTFLGALNRMETFWYVMEKN